MNEERTALFASLGWERPPALIDEALTHRSFTNERHGRGKRAPARDNQRLEFLGDSVLNLCVSELLMAAFPDADEGLLSRMRANLVNTDPLAEFGRAVGLGAALRLGRGSQASGDNQQANVLADAVEALVGAAYLDGGLAAARDLVGRIVGEGLRNAATLGGLDPKSALQERVQASGGPTPIYRVVSPSGPDHNATSFTVEVVTGDQVLGQGEGRTKKAAQQSAARDALSRWSPPAADASSQPPTSQPQAGQPPTSQPQAGQPPSGQTPTTQPQAGQPPSGRAADGLAADGRAQADAGGPPPATADRKPGAGANGAGR